MLTGPNGTGKTSLLEAVGYLGLGRSSGAPTRGDDPQRRRRAIVRAERALRRARPAGRGRAGPGAGAPGSRSTASRRAPRTWRPRCRRPPSARTTSPWSRAARPDGASSSTTHWPARPRRRCAHRGGRQGPAPAQRPAPPGRWPADVTTSGSPSTSGTGASAARR